MAHKCWYICKCALKLFLRCRIYFGYINTDYCYGQVQSYQVLLLNNNNNNCYYYDYYYCYYSVLVLQLLNNNYYKLFSIIITDYSVLC
jgi:hypothetical protein